MTLTVRVDSQRWRAIEQRLTPAAVDRVVRAVALDIQADTVRSIQNGPKTGRTYRRGKGGRRIHRASAPGEAPATDRGALASSYRAKPVRSGVWRVGSGLAYARALEDGTRTVKARPHLRPAFHRARAVMRRRIKQLLGGK